jgi:hypothetical protein
MTSFRVPFNRTKGANDIRVSFNGTRVPRSRVYSSERGMHSDREPEFRRDCYETYAEWIKEQDLVVGCMFNLWDEHILRLLKERLFTFVVTNSRGDEKLFRDPKFDLRCDLDKVIEIASQCTDFTMSEGKEEMKTKDIASLINQFSGLFVFPEYKGGGDNYAYLMYHKFLVGIKVDFASQETNYVLSAIYGSFNLSTGATKNLDSVLVFRDNEQLCEMLIRETFLTFTSSIPWIEYCKDKGREWSKHAYREYISKDL